MVNRIDHIRDRNFDHIRDNDIYYGRDRNLLLLIYFLFYYAVLFGLVIDYRLLFQYHPIFFNFNRDLTELSLIATGLPRWMIAHPASFTIADVLAFLIPLPLIRQHLRRNHLPQRPAVNHPPQRPAVNHFSPWPGVVFIAYLTLYLLLGDIFWQIHHEPFILFFLLGLVWSTTRPDRFYLLLKGCRYYFLYIFVSAAIWKLARGAVFNSSEMSRILLLHHTDLLTGSCSSVTCKTLTWLIAHPPVSQALYIAATLLEAIFLIGFFTHRFDRLLIMLAILFVIADLLLMHIPYWTILLGAVPLWIREPTLASKDKKIVLYETTHHENLPALLDLCETEFNQTTVFLKERSYHNLTGEGAPEQRWPLTDFYIQTAGCPNRRFIRQLFQHLRRHGSTHLHLCTLDNNLLLFALQLSVIGPVHLSLTVHEVNEYFFRSYRTLRDTTESLAKFLLHRLIHHYHFFLPAMAGQFRERLPEAVTVFIPSRFYSGHGHSAPSPPFRIVFPGSLDPNRRNYAEVMEALATLPFSPINLILLGDASTEAGATIIAELRSKAPTHITIRHFSGYIPQSTYEREITTAHLIWSPLNIHKKSSRNSPETYGLTTASGLTADLLLNNIPALVPAALIIPDSFRPAIYPYQSPEEAQAFIRRLIEDPAAYTTLRETIHHAFSYFSKENFGHAFDELIRT